MGWHDYPFDFEEEGEESGGEYSPDIVFFVTEPEVIGTLYGPDGEILAEYYEDRVPFGYRKEQ